MCLTYTCIVSTAWVYSVLCTVNSYMYHTYIPGMLAHETLHHIGWPLVRLHGVRRLRLKRGFLRLWWRTLIGVWCFPMLGCNEKAWAGKQLTVRFCEIGSRIRARRFWTESAYSTTGCWRLWQWSVSLASFSCDLLPATDCWHPSHH